MLAPNHFLIRYRRTIAQAALLVYVLNPLLVTAQVIVNAGTANDGRRTFVDQTQSGVTKINITTPNGAGVSHNSYQQFDVPKTGVVLNNGGNNSNTRIAGWVEGNPNLRPGQEAKLILNEVLGGKASQLQGYLEVAGTKADVIVANENGITCNGCGFINTDRATLTTGKPVFGSDGALQQMRVQQGQVTVGPDGLQAADTRVDILSSYANIQGDIHAANIQAVVGQNDIHYVTGQVTKQATAKGTSSPANAPSSGLDVGALGGMYANQISLVATGEGVGVKIDGKLLSAGQIAIQSDGSLTHKGQTQGDAGVQLKAQTLEQAGQVISAKTVDLQAAQLRNSGTTQGQQLRIAVSEDASNSGHLKALDAGLHMQVGGTLRNESGADILSQSQVQINAAQVVNAGLIEAGKVAVKTSANVINQGQIKAQDGGLVLDAGGALQNQKNASIVSQSDAQVIAQSLTNDAAVQATKISIQTAGDATNSGRITAGAAGLQMQIGGALRNDKGGAILSQNAVQLNAMTLTNAGDIIATDKSTLHATEVSNSGVMRSESALEISQAQKLDNSGTLAAKLITLQAASTQNSGSIEAQSLTLTGTAKSANAATSLTSPTTLDNSGVMAAQNIRLTDLAQINNSGKITTWTEGASTQGTSTQATSQGQDLFIQTQQLNNAGGTLLAQRDITLITEQLDNRSGTIGNAAGSMAISTQGNLDNRSGSIVQQGASAQLQITSDLALDNSNGHIEGQGRVLRIEAGDLSNNSGKILLTAGADAATVQGTSPVQIPAQMDLRITANPQASTPTAGQLRNIQGQISSSGNVTIQAQSVITDPGDPQLSQPSSLSFMDKSKATSGTGSTSSTPYNWQTDIAAADKVTKAKAALDAATATATTAATTLTAATLAEQTAIAQKTSTASQLTADQAKLVQAQTKAKAAQTAADAAPQDATLAKAAKDAQAQVTLAQAQVSTDKTADQKAATAVTQAKADVQTATSNKAAADAAQADAQTAYASVSAEVKPVGTGSSSTSAPDVAKPTDLQLTTPTAAPVTRAPSVIQAAGDLQMTIGAGGVDNRQGKIQAQNIQITTDGNLWAISAGAGSAALEIGNQTANDQVAKALAHALAGCMAGGASGGKQGCESGAIGAVVGELAAQWYDPNGTKPPKDTLDFVKVVSAAAGAITGDGSAASVSTAVMTGVNAAMNNRLMHFDEKERIRIAAGGDADKQERLTKAACFEIKCWAQFPEGSDLYKANYVSVAEISGLQAEWDWVKRQKDFGAFNYTTTQKLTDIVASTTGMASGTFGGKPISSGGSNTQSCATAECVAGLMPAPSEMRSVEQIDRDLKSGVCKSLVGNVVNTLVPGSLVMRPIINSTGKAIGWAVEKGFDKSTSNVSGSVICKG